MIIHFLLAFFFSEWMGISYPNFFIFAKMSRFIQDGWQILTVFIFAFLAFGICKKDETIRCARGLFIPSWALKFYAYWYSDLLALCISLIFTSFRVFFFPPFPYLFWGIGDNKWSVWLRRVFPSFRRLWGFIFLR